MRPTRLGWGWLFVTGLTLFTAGSTSNNLLYLVYAALLGGALLAVVLGRLNLRSILVVAQPRGQIFKGERVSLPVEVKNEGRFAAYAVEVLWQESGGFLERIGSGETETAVVRGMLPNRGLNSLDDLVVESSFPLNLFRFRLQRPLLELIALPPPQPVREPKEVAAQARASGRPALRKGAGEELFGLREYEPGDDVRLLNWKMSARLGRSVVNEYCDSRDDRVTVSVGATKGETGEAEIARAASACRYYIEGGAQVRLESPEQTVDYGRGLGHLDKLLTALGLLGDGAAARPSGPAPRISAPRARDGVAARRLLLFGASATYAGLFLIDDVSPTLLWALAPALLLGVFVQEKRRPVLPSFVWSVLSLGVLIGTGLIEWRRSGVALANVHLMLYLLLNRVLNPFQEKEFGQILLILFLAFFLTSGLTISPWYFLLFLGFGAAASGWLTLTLGFSWSSRRRWLGAWAGPAVGGAVAAILLFAATPRVEGWRRINPFIAAGMDKLAVPESAVTGFTDQISLGFYGRLRKSSARVMRVKLLPPPREQWPGAVYIRGASFDRFDGVRWSKSRSPGRWPAFAAGRLLFPVKPPPERHVVFDFTIYPMATSVAFTIGTPWQIEGSPQPAFVDDADTVRFASLYSNGIHYQVHSSLAAGFPDTDPARFLGVPPDPSGRVAALAREAAAGAADPLAKVVSVQNYLRGHYDYSLYSDGGGKDLEAFLFKTRKGNCEYFASAGVVLLRHLGVPSRLVSGFLASDWNEFGRFYDVRQAQAHAWVEAYVPGEGWMRADPTPPESAWRTEAEAFSRKLEHWFAVFEAGWYRHVIGYDQYVQRAAFHRWSASLTPQAISARLRGLARAAAPFLALLLGGEALRRARLRLNAPKPSLFELAQRALARAGFSRAPSMTAREFAAAVVARRPDLAPVEGLAEFDDARRFRPGGATVPERESAEALLRGLLDRLKG